MTLWDVNWDVDACLSSVSVGVNFNAHCAFLNTLSLVVFSLTSLSTERSHKAMSLLHCFELNCPPDKHC
jgi:hypothetical protein